MATRQEVIASMEACENKNTFDVHVDPVDYNMVIKVDKKFPYIKPLWLKFVFLIQKIVIVKPFILYINRKYRTKFYNRKNIKGIKSAILTCNHVDMFDCLVANQAVFPKRLLTTAAPFNNRKGFLGHMMRVGDMLPMSEDYQGMKNFTNSIGHYLKKNNFVMFYPEQAMWWHYEKPRPLKDGAYHFAVKYNVPVIPLIITFTNEPYIEKNGLLRKKFHLHILKPIYPKAELSKQENMEYLKAEDFKQRKQKYEEFYGKPLEYETRL